MRIHTLFDPSRRQNGHLPYIWTRNSPSRRDIGTFKQRENIVGSKWLLLLLGAAPATGIAMCQIAVVVEAPNV